MAQRLLFLLPTLPLLFLATCGGENASPPRVEGKKVLMIIAPKNFRDEELLEPKGVLTQAGAVVEVASTSLDTAVGMLGAEVGVDLLVDSVRVADYDAVVFVGGMGASQYWESTKAHSIAQEASQTGKVLGAICIAPVTLANAGLLREKKATVWASEKERIEAKGAKYTGSSVQVDGRIITADGPKAAREFGQTILKALSQ